MSEKKENPGECSCCGYETNKLQLFEDADTTIAGGGKVVRSDFWFCKLCAGSMASVAYRYPGQYTDGASMRTICFVGNVILEALKTRR